MSVSAGLVSLAVRFPSVARTNDFWRRRYPAVVESQSDRALARMWTKKPGDEAGPARIFDEEMAPYLADPFRGSVERRILGPGESALSCELAAAREALAAAGLQAKDVSLCISSAFVPDRPGLGHAAYLAKELGIGGTAWNLETACSSGLEALRTAAALVKAEEHENVLVVVSCMYSRVADPEDTISWAIGDGAAAFVVGKTRGAVLGAKGIHTGETCGAMFYEPSGAMPSHLAMRSDPASGKVLRETAGRFLEECCEGALKAAKVSKGDVRFFAFNTPTAWYAAFCARTLGISPDQTISTFEAYGNIGPVLMPANLFTAAKAGRILEGDLVLLYSVGSVSSAGAVVMRWGDVKLGPDVQPALTRE